MRCIYLGLLLVACSTEASKDAKDDSVGLESDSGDDLGEQPDPHVDSDGDGYTDAQEMHAGTDPNDPTDRIYQGGWPYNMNKDGLISPGWDAIPGPGAMIPEYTAQDQFGDTVNLYDLAGQGKKIVLDVGTEFCGPCKALAAYLSTDDMGHLIWNDAGEYYPWWKAEYSHLYELVQNEDIYWVTILFSENEPYTTWEDAAEWEEAFPNEKIIVLADTDLTLYHYLDIQSFPAISVLDENMNFLLYSNSSPAGALQEICLD